MKICFGHFCFSIFGEGVDWMAECRAFPHGYPFVGLDLYRCTWRASCTFYGNVWTCVLLCVLFFLSSISALMSYPPCHFPIHIYFLLLIQFLLSSVASYLSDFRTSYVPLNQFLYPSFTIIPPTQIFTDRFLPVVYSSFARYFVLNSFILLNLQPPSVDKRCFGRQPLKAEALAFKSGRTKFKEKKNLGGNRKLNLLNSV